MKSARSIVEPVKGVASLLEEFDLLREMGAEAGEDQVVGDMEALLPRIEDLVHDLDFRVMLGGHNDRCVYTTDVVFPLTGAVSLVTLMDDGESVDRQAGGGRHPSGETAADRDELASGGVERAIRTERRRVGHQLRFSRGAVLGNDERDAKCFGDGGGSRSVRQSRMGVDDIDPMAR